MSKAKILDVAKAAGVSISTVSRVINGNYPVSDEARKKVEQVIKELDYHPNVFASSLKRGSSKIVGFVASKIVNPSMMQIVRGVQSVLSEYDYTVYICSSGNKPERERKMLSYFKESLVDLAMVCSADYTPEYLDQISKKGMPIILVDRYFETDVFHKVTEKNYDMAYDLTKHLIDKGHKKIMVFTGINHTMVSIDRLSAFKKAMNDAGIVFDERNQITADFSDKIAYEKMNEILKNTPREKLPTAIFSFSGLMTEGVVKALYENGLTIPEDMSVVSYGEVNGHKLLYPRITCMRQDSFKLGEEAGNLAMDILLEREKITGNKAIYSPTVFEEGDSVLDIN